VFVGGENSFCLDVNMDRRSRDCRASAVVAPSIFLRIQIRFTNLGGNTTKREPVCSFWYFRCRRERRKEKEPRAVCSNAALTSRECAECLHSLSCSPSSSPKQFLWQLPWAPHSFRIFQYHIIIQPNGHSDTTVRLHYSSPMTLPTLGDS
jgi:hypothetical protein